jgi:hypothetical protein
MLIAAALQIATGEKPMQKENGISKRIRAAAHAARLTLRVLLLGSFAMTTPLFSQSGADTTQTPPELVQVVRQATQKYTNVNTAISAGYQPVLGCVSGQDHGAMGVHYLNASLLNGELDATQPQALIYEPLGGGSMRLVGVEFIVDAATWQKKNTAPPQLYQQLLQLIPSPNRYGLNTFYELHVWAWQDNPNGAFVDWNNKVNCNLQGTTL